MKVKLFCLLFIALAILSVTACDKTDHKPEDMVSVVKVAC